MISLRLTETLVTENTGLKPGDKYKVLNPMAEANGIAKPVVVQKPIVIMRPTVIAKVIY